MGDKLQKATIRIEKLERSPFHSVKIETGELDLEEHNRALETINLIASSFNLNELKELALELKLDIENITGTTRREKAVALVSHYVRRNDLDTLIHWVSGKRKNIKWPETKLDRAKIENMGLEDIDDSNSILY